eukprot:TRINITY_DN4803_c0_g1_i2.p1 TRINITY_DN4803_c0_g1~~TRINITY_DN4803_c0_g1_i2.p1  ORF type:complete len:214 (-),score=85.64 TRINITY_DN4803_c0_g1_i2:105-722(-)
MNKIVLALFVFAAVVSAQVCGGSNCNTCLATPGCHWCSKYAGTSSFCTNITTASAAGCTETSQDGNDQWYTTVTQCAGGCAQYQQCSECTSTTGCGWCHVGTAGCRALVNGTLPQCSVFTEGTCERPCAARTDCSDCLRASCKFCPEQINNQPGTCYEDDDNSATCGPNFQVTIDQCPKRDTGAASGLTVVASFVVSCVAAVLLM